MSKYRNNFKATSKKLRYYRKLSASFKSQLVLLESRLNVMSDNYAVAINKLSLLSLDKEEENSSESAFTLDPFWHIIEGLHQHIMQHLTGSNLLKMSEVSPSWYKMTMDPKSMKKVQLNCILSAEKTNDEKIQFVEMMKESSRTYRNIKAAYDSGTQSDAIEIIRKSAETMETLDVGEIYGDESALPKQEWKLLKKVKAGFVSNSMFEFVMTQNVQLETLILDNNFDISRNLDALVKFLASQRELEVLYIRSSWAMLLFFAQDLINEALEGFTDPSPFQLKKLFIGTSHEISLGSFELILFGMFRFLNSQRIDLKNLVFLSVCDRLLLNYIFNFLPALETISLRSTDQYLLNITQVDLDLKPNTNVKELRLGKQFPDNDIEQMIRSLPELKILGLEYLKNTQVQFVAETSVKLQLLEYNCIEDVDFYEQLKISRDDNINKKIKVQMIDVGEKTIFGEDF